MTSGHEYRANRPNNGCSDHCCKVKILLANPEPPTHGPKREFDVVVYPSAAVPAFPQDHSEPIEARQIDIDGKAYPYLDAFFLWADPATTCGLPATAAPINRSATGLPIGVQIIGPYLEDRTTIAFAELLEREFGGFVPPPST